MSWECRGLDIGGEAAGDISGSQYKGVKLDSSKKIAACDTAGEVIFGVLQNNPNAAGKSASIRTSGVTKMVAGAAVSAVMTELVVDNTGRCVAAANLEVASGTTAVTSTAANGGILTGSITPKKIIGVALETAGAANDVIAVLLK